MKLPLIFRENLQTGQGFDFGRDLTLSSPGWGHFVPPSGFLCVTRNGFMLEAEIS